MYNPLRYLFRLISFINKLSFVNKKQRGLKNILGTDQISILTAKSCKVFSINKNSKSTPPFREVIRKL